MPRHPEQIVITTNKAPSTPVAGRFFNIGPETVGLLPNIPHNGLVMLDKELTRDMADPKEITSAVSGLWAAIEPGGSIMAGSCTALPSGYEATVYSISSIRGDGTKINLIIKLYPMAERSDTKASSEYGTLQNLFGHLPIPKPYAMVLSDKSSLGGPYIVMERVGSRDMWQVMNEADDAGKSRVIGEFASVMKRLHTMDWRSLSLLAPSFDPEDPNACQRNSLALGEEILSRLPGSGEWLEVLRWMIDHYREVPCAGYALTHNDFHPANIMVDDSGCLHPIDWTNGKIGDPRSELAWTYVTMINHHWFNNLFMKAYPFDMHGDMRYFLVGAALTKVFSIVQPFVDGSDGSNLLPHTREGMLRCGGQIRACHELLTGITGIELPSVELFLKRCMS